MQGVGGPWSLRPCFQGATEAKQLEAGSESLQGGSDRRGAMGPKLQWRPQDGGDDKTMGMFRGKPQHRLKPASEKGYVFQVAVRK